VDRYAVFGNPIDHSKSPFIHQQFAAAMGEPLQYDAILAPLDGFADSWHSFVRSGGKGANVTVPFKQQAFQLADRLSDRARQAGAVNTLFIDSHGRLCGDNTDGSGLIADLKRLGIALDSSVVLLLGAGGAGRGVIGPLLDAGVRQLVLANRTVSKAQLIASSFDNRVIACGYDQIPQLEYQLVINATSSGLTGERPAIAPLHLRHCLLAYDMLYGAIPTPFLQWAKREGVPQQADGLGLLVAQAAEAFFIWRGKQPDMRPVLALLQQLMTV
jgi:shikimate dehydrogenase